MGIIETVKGWWNKMFRAAVTKTYGVTGIESTNMREAIKEWMQIYIGDAPWINRDEDIKTIKFAKKICSSIANLATLDIDVAFDGPRKEYMQQFYDRSVAPKLREWLEYGCAAGTAILKPNGVGVDFLTPDKFEIIAKDGNHNITDIVFQDQYQDGTVYYTKLERHKFWEMDVKYTPDQEDYKRVVYYTITNKCFSSKKANDIGQPCSILDTKWKNLKDEVNINKQNGEGLNGMLFGMFRMPHANDIDINSPLGISAFANAIEELKDLDVAYSRNATEIFDSRRIALVDERLVQLPSTMEDGKVRRHKLQLPKFVRNVNADDPNSYYQEINPTINIEQRKQEIDFQLSLIGCKCGFSNGYFVLDQKTGMITATQVEADDRETIQLIKDVRDSLKKCLEDLFYAQSKFADLYGLAPVAQYEANYNFGDITYNYEEDKSRWWSYVQAGKVPAWMYFVKFEGMSEEEARAMQDEAEPKEDGLFKTE